MFYEIDRNNGGSYIFFFSFKISTFIKIHLGIISE